MTLAQRQELQWRGELRHICSLLDDAITANDLHRARTLNERARELTSRVYGRSGPRMVSGPPALSSAAVRGQSSRGRS